MRLRVIVLLLSLFLSTLSPSSPGCCDGSSHPPVTAGKRTCAVWRRWGSCSLGHPVQHPSGIPPFCSTKLPHLTQSQVRGMMCSLSSLSTVNTSLSCILVHIFVDFLFIMSSLSSFEHPHIHVLQHTHTQAYRVLPTSSSPLYPAANTSSLSARLL